MGRGGQLVTPTRGEGVYSWEEIEKHDKREDKWLVIDGNVYDITQWSKKHPGGSKVISHYAGQDGSEPFRAFHTDPEFVRKYMKALHIGKLDPGEDKRDEIIEDMNQLRETAEKMGLFKPSVTFFAVQVAHIVVLDALAYWLLWYYGTGWLPWIASIVIMGAVQTQAGWIQHDFGHHSVFHGGKLNYFFHLMLMGFYKGASPHWWNHMHFQHHAKPNVIDKDPDVRLEKLFVLGDTMSKTVAKSDDKTLPYNWQNYYFFALGPPLLIPVFFQIMVFRHVYTRKQWLDLAFMAVFYLKIIFFYGALLGPGVIAYFFLVRLIEGHWFLWVTQSNHIPMEIDEDKRRQWLPLQLHATCDIEQSWFNDWFTGHLNFQIEHHLFPTMPRHNLYKIMPLAKSLCEKHQIPHTIKSLHGAFADIIRSLKSSGALWESYYHEFHS